MYTKMVKHSLAMKVRSKYSVIDDEAQVAPSERRQGGGLKMITRGRLIRNKEIFGKH